MITIVLSNPRSIEGEIQTICELFENGMEVFHLRKKGYSTKRVEQILKQIPEKYHSKIVLHSKYQLVLKYNLRGIHITSSNRKNSFFEKLKILYYRFKRPNLKISSSFNHLSSLIDDKKTYDYVFISPVFDSISKSGYQSAFTHHHLNVILPKTGKNVIALGGIELDKVEQVKEMKFAGLALSGIIWQSPLDQRVSIFKGISNKVKDVG
jgi:thiamine-phosphate pyrophosphorylase